MSENPHVKPKFVGVGDGSVAKVSATPKGGSEKSEESLRNRDKKSI
jgi:hypothetical protein